MTRSRSLAAQQLHDATAVAHEAAAGGVELELTGQLAQLEQKTPSSELIGVGIAIVGIVIWARNSITRYLRYWIIRLVYEQREQTVPRPASLPGSARPRREPPRRRRGRP